MPFYSFFAHSSRSSVPTLTLVPFADQSQAFEHAETMLAKETHYLSVEVVCGDEVLGRVHQVQIHTMFPGEPLQAADHVVQTS